MSTTAYVYDRGGALDLAHTSCSTFSAQIMRYAPTAVSVLYHAASSERPIPLDAPPSDQGLRRRSLSPNVRRELCRVRHRRASLSGKSAILGASHYSAPCARRISQPSNNRAK